jgi:hypothetical protein
MITTFLLSLFAKFALVIFGLWTTPRTWVAGELVTASMMNTHVRDNMNAVKGFIPTGFSGLSLRTHPDADKSANQVSLIAVDQLVMSDGARYSGITTLPLSADITVAGAGGLDTGARTASTWYEIYVIGKSSTQAQSDLRVMLHRAKDFKADQSQATGAATGLGMRADSVRTALGQGIKFTTAGPVPFIDIKLGRTGTVSGRMWLTIQSDNAGLPSGVVLATSDKMDAGSSPATAQTVRFPFRTPFTVVAGTQYHLVFQGDYTINASNYVEWFGDTVNSYAGGVSEVFDGATWTVNGAGLAGACLDFWFKLYVTENDTALTMPAGYDQSVKIGFVYNSSGNALARFKAVNRRVLSGGQFLVVNNVAATAAILYDLSAFIPPVPVVYYASAANGTATDDTNVSGVPEGYGGLANYAGWTSRVYDAKGGGNVQGINVIVPTEAQGIYVWDGAGSAYLYDGGYEW